ncbi:MurR/RpiR family transcriptional regulator [Phyllobacterium zundukense]|uniref:RpiR family transcriptional regulator n=1 Tax=Phyllobacterium zundukense TaxID=1867719 RepID=A0A2N9W1A9_9HYPH|nr:MurR/RpiR family transcriptional regulator [Phyllobacterium zundukense]ATU95373.1 RpiR family transcriptional regulator [Phyllobacterium zundukense]PIO45527.1 RpiR family transcriptional regulator [Phyllobacterium zundukense]
MTNSAIAGETVREQIRRSAESLTATERRLSALILSNYPFAGLEPIQVIAAASNVSAPSISRFVTKLGYQGLQDFQQQLIKELKQGQKSPLDLRTTTHPLADDFFEKFTEKSTELLRASARSITIDQFERVGSLLADPKSEIFTLGGRISDLVAQYLSRHLKQIRPGVHQVSSEDDWWPEYILRMRQKDVLVLVDFRRYQRSLEDFAARASKHCGIKIVLITDRWMSPISKYAGEVLPLHIENDTAFDSNIAAFSLIEALLTRVAEANWSQASQRIKQWDSLRSPPSPHTDAKDTP